MTELICNELPKSAVRKGRCHFRNTNDLRSHEQHGEAAIDIQRRQTSGGLFRNWRIHIFSLVGPDSERLTKSAMEDLDLSIATWTSVMPYAKIARHRTHERSIRRCAISMSGWLGSVGSQALTLKPLSRFREPR